MVSTIQNTALQMRYRSMITAKHHALIIPWFNWAPWQQRSSARRTMAHKARHRQRWWWLSPKSSRRHQILPMAAIDHRTPENTQLPPCPHQFTAETYRAQRPNGAQGASPTLKMMIMSTGPFLQVNWARLPVQAPTIDGVTLPLNAAISRIEVRSDNFRVSTVTTPVLPIEPSAPILVCVYTYSSTILEEANLPKHYTYTYGRGSVYESSTPTATNINTSNVHSRRSHPTIEWHWGWEACPRLNRTYSGDTLRSVKCIYGERPTQFRRPPTTTMMTTMTAMTMMTSQSTSIMDNRGGNWQIKHQWPLHTRQVETIGGADTNDDSGWKCSVNIYSANIVHEVQIPETYGEMQPVLVLIDCGATSIFIWRHWRFSKRLGILH